MTAQTEVPGWLEDLIRESNLIDRQYDDAGRLIPGEKPGDEMFDRQLAAWEVFSHYRERNQAPDSLYQDAHREMTRGLDWFETRGASGFYRSTRVRVGDQECLAPGMIEPVMREVVMPHYRRLHEWAQIRREEGHMDRQLWRPLGNATFRHHCLLESVHPFLDGNGRIGRLGLANLELWVGAPQTLIEDEDKQLYYYDINSYQRYHFDADRVHGVPDPEAPLA